MTSRSFALADQIAFGELSGDFNPLHVDEVQARRLMFGAPAVHGLHTLLWSLDVWARQAGRRFALTAIKATFFKPVRIDTEVRVLVQKEEAGRVTLVVQANGEAATRIDVEWRERDDADEVAVLDRRYGPEAPVELADYESAAGEIPLQVERDLAGRLFPTLSQAMPLAQLGALLASTRLVGMKCPGLHSVYTSLALTFDGPGGSPLGYRVKTVNRRFAMVIMEVGAHGLSGEIRAFIRPQPRQQLSMAAAKDMVSPAEFAGQRAVVVGGSRGLGEVTAKLLAAGGAEVLVTYHRGAADAEAIVREINAAGGKASASALNVLEPADDGALPRFGATELYYFATPFIATGRKGSFSQALFEQFCRYYLAGFSNTLTLLSGPTLRAVFNPSSVFVEDVPETLVEYATAKAASEFLCRALAATGPAGLRIAWPRLPKMDTDQTASLTPSAIADPAPVLLSELRAFHAG